jgi:uncharacterized protein (TIGR03435 family)
MAGFADMLTRVMQMDGSSSRQVVDSSNLKGYYEVSLDLSLAKIMAMAKASGMDLPAGAQAESGGAFDPEGGDSVLESVRKLGLKLEAQKSTVSRLVVDNVTKTPTEN